MENAMGFLFGHYDSRGGATLMIGDATLEDATKRYVEQSFLTSPEDSWYEDLVANLGEEIMAVVAVRYDPQWIGHDVLFEPNEDDPNILWGLVHENTDIHEGSIQNISNLIEIVISTTPPKAPYGMKYGLLHGLGEDAYGLVAL